MQVITAHTIGFCPGVKRAFQLAEKALQSSREPVFLLGDLVHNRKAVQSLVDRGAIKIEKPEEARAGSLVVSRSHGLEKAAGQAIDRRGATVIDTTCPRVKKIHSLGCQLEKDGFALVVLGNAAHAEVRALVSHLQRPPWVIGESPLDWEKLPPLIEQARKPVAVLEQTTFPQPAFQAFVNWIQERELFFPIEIHDTLCPETGLRQKELADQIRTGGITVVVLLGGKHSSNTRALALLAEHSALPLLWVESAEEIQPQWFGKNNRIFLTSGASTPDVQVQKTFRYLQDIAAGK
ncbi:MAG TPA: 4-hydroxy-3-methylbut-2-enyl diphosphate reductase [Atribacteraceae bacterium]|nr:4-hydroxy-3-methylbut-2-enyl diphosphate reductase [Atribacteraceae bacterium]